MAIPIRMPEINFDWLAELPTRSAAARIRQARESLGDLSAGDAKSLEAAATRLLQAGDLEGSLRLQNAATARRGVDQRGISDRLYFDKILPALRASQQAEGDSGYESPVIPQSGGAGDYNPAPSPFPNPPAPGTQSSIPEPVEIPPSPTLAERPQRSPSEEILAQAEDAPTPLTLGPQLAQAGGGPIPGLMPPAPEGGVPTSGWAAGIQARPAGPPLAVQQAQPQQQGPILPSQLKKMQTNREIQRLTNDLFSIPPSMRNSEAAKVLSTKLKDAINRTELSKEDREYEFDQIQNRYHGDPLQTKSDWRHSNEVGGKREEEMMKMWSKYVDEGDKGIALKSTVDQMKIIMNDKNFITGASAELFSQGVGMVRALADQAKALGINLPSDFLNRFEGVATAEKAAALSNTFTALSNQALFKTLGSLGNQISSSDRVFMEKAYNSLRNTKEGNKLLAEILSDAADKSIATGQAAQKYRLDRDAMGRRATAPGMKAAVDKAAADGAFFKNGELTEKGRYFQRQIDNIKRFPQEAYGMQEPVDAIPRPEPEGPGILERLQNTIRSRRPPEGGYVVDRIGQGINNFLGAFNQGLNPTRPRRPQSLGDLE